MKLTDPTDQDLNRAFADEVAGWVIDDKKPDYGIGPKSNMLIRIPQFTEEIDSTKEFLKRCETVVIRLVPMTLAWEVVVSSKDTIAHAAEMSLSKAIVLALLRVQGVEVEFTR